MENISNQSYKGNSQINGNVALKILNRIIEIKGKNILLKTMLMKKSLTDKANNFKN